MREPEEAERAHLEQDPGEVDAAGGGRLDVRIGSQVWNGKIGTLTANASAKALKSHGAYGASRSLCWTR